jgi:alpha-galactosidase
MPPENEPATAEGAVVALTAAGVTLLAETTGGGVPSVVHWGPELPGLDAGGAASLLDSGTAPVGPNDIDEPIRLAVLPEHTTGWSGRPGLVGSRGGRGWSTRFRHVETTLDGEPVAGFVAAGAGLLEARSVEEELGLDLVVRLEMLASGLVRGQAEVTNRADDPYQLESLTLALPVPAEAGELLDFSGRWARERVPQRRPFTVGTHLRENRKGRTGADSAYVLHAGTPGFGFASGEVYAVHTAFSGNHLHYAERTHTGARVLGGGELLLPGEVRLEQGESYRSPWLYGASGTGLDATAHRFHRHLRARPRPVGPDRPVTLNVWEAVYFDHDVDRLRHLAERASALGVERYVLDDGWFGSRRDDNSGLGDWVVSPDVWPEGLHPLVDHVHELGMQFGLWFEPEMVNADSDVARAHPEWVMAARGRWPVESRHQQVLNLGIPEAYQHVKGQLLAILDEYAIDYIKWDHNRDLVEAGTQPDGGRPGVHAQTLAFYRLLDELREVHPDLEIESCSSGGARVDLGVLERADRVWVSDCIDPLERQHMVRWTTQLIPPEYMGAHIASGRSHTTGRVHDLGFRASTAVFGHLGIEWDLAQASPEELEELGSWLAFYDRHRRLLLTGDVVRMDGYDEHLMVHGVVAEDRAEAVFALALVGSLESSPGPRVRFRGLDAAASYRVRPALVGAPPSGLRPPAWWGAEADGYPGCVLTGAALEHVGVVPPVVDPDHAVLFHVVRA